METVQLSPRFRVLRWLHRPDQDGGLAEVRDAATDDVAWALWFARRRDVGLAVAIHHRLAALRGLRILPELERVRVIETEDGTVVLFDPIDGVPRSGRDSLSPGVREQTLASLSEWAASGRRLGPVDESAWWQCADRWVLLPSIWLPPLEPGPLHSHVDFVDPIDAVSRVAEATRTLGLDPTALGHPAGASPPRVAADLADALADVERTGGWINVIDAQPGAVAREIEAWARQRNRPCARLLDFAPLAVGRRERGTPAVVVLEDTAGYPGVADALVDLQRNGWADGHELLVAVSRAALDDEILGLYGAARFGRGSGHELRREAGTSARRPVEEASVAGRVLAFVEAAGRAITGHVLARATGCEPPQLAQALLQLAASELVELTHGRHAEVSGSQLLVRAAATTNEQPASRRAELRALIGAALETRSRPSFALQWLRADAVAGRGSAEVARRWRELAHRAQSKGRDLLALAAYGRLLERADPDAVTLEDRVKAAIAQSSQYQRAGDIERATATLLAALDRVHHDGGRLQPDLEAELVLTLAAQEIHRSDFAAAEQRLSALLARSKDRLGVEPRARAYVDLGWALLFLGRTRESVRTSELALRILDPLRHAALVARTHNQIGFALYKESDYSGSLVHYERALRLREELGDELGVARTYNNLALTQRALGQPEAAEASLRECLRRKRAAGDELSYAASLLNLGLVQIDLRQPDAAEQSAVACLEIAGAHGHPETEAEAWGLRGEAALASGHPELALEYLERDLAICDATEHQSERLVTLRRLAEVLSVLGRDADAAHRLEQGRELLAAQPSRYETAMIDRLDGEIRLRAGETAAAIELFGAAARGFGALGLRGQQVESLARRGGAEIRSGNSARARATLAELRELIGRHELHKVPDAVNEFERALQRAPVASGPLAADDCLNVLVEALAAPGHGPEGAAHVATSLMTALAAPTLLWIRPDGSASAPIGDHWEAVDLPHELERIDGPVVPGDVDRRGQWNLVALAAGSGGGWIAVEREVTLRAAEQQLMRGLARAWARTTLPALDADDAHGWPGADEESPSLETHGLVGRSAAVREILQMIKKVAATDVSVLILGENGTGKELVAQAIHRASARRRARFIAVNCASIPGTLLESELFGHERGAFTSAHARRLGRFELAHGGTLMLDEIGEMPLEMQAKILRVLQERTFTRLGGTELVRSDARILAATNRDLEREVERGRFRMDLYFRLNVVTIRVPSLRERVEDIEPLARHFLQRHGPEYGARVRDVSPDALRALTAYAWPGNVRELENAVKHALVFASTELLRAEDLPSSVLGTGAGPRDRDLEQAARGVVDSEDYSTERPLLPRLELLLAHEMVRRVGNKTEAARLLGVTKPTLYDRLRRFETLYGEDDD